MTMSERKPFRKSTKAEIEIRLAEVQRLLLTAASRSQIVQHCTDKYQISVSNVDRYIHRANQRIADDYQRSQQTYLARNQRLREQILMRALQNNQLNTAVTVLRDIDRYAGNEPTQRLKVSFDEAMLNRIQGSLANADDEQLARIANGENILEVLGAHLSGELAPAPSYQEEAPIDQP